MSETEKHPQRGVRQDRKFTKKYGKSKSKDSHKVNEMKSHMQELKRELIQPEKIDKVDIVHYESPPRKRLREQEDEKINELKEVIRVENERELREADPQGTIDRLMMSRQEKNERILALQKRKLREEQMEVLSRPDISSSYNMKRDYVPIIERPQKKENYDETLQKRRNANPNRFKNDMENCTFSPDIGNKRRKNEKVDPNKSVDRLLEWGRIREGKVAKRVIENAGKEEVYSFRPQLSNRTRKIVGKNSARGIPIHERLLKQGKDRDKWIKSQRKIEQDGMFQPYICKKSKKILAKKNESLIKIDNGKTQTVSYYTAIPKESKNNERVPEKGSKSKSKKSRKVKKSRSPAKTPEKNLRFKTPNKKKDRSPEYVSPYNPKVMTSDIPLTSILKKSRIHREKLRKKKRDEFEGKTDEMPIKIEKDPYKFYKGNKTPQRKNISNLPLRTKSRKKSVTKSFKREFSTEIKTKNKRNMESTKKKKTRDLIYSRQKNSKPKVEKESAKNMDIRAVKSFKAQSARSVSRKSRKSVGARATRNAELVI